MGDKYFYLFTCCILTKGHERSIIVDVQRRQIYFIPNTLYSILEICREYTVKEISDYYIDQKVTLDQYFNFLINNELGLYTDNIDEFPAVDLKFQNPRKLTNAIIEFSEKYDFIDVVSQLDQLNCEALELRFIDYISHLNLATILDSFKHSSFRSIDLVLPFSEDFSEEKSEVFFQLYPRLKNVFIYKSNFEKKNKLNTMDIFYKTQENIIASECGKVGKEYFSPSFSQIKESQHCNSCLNKKIAINYDGVIKNCPSMDKNWGNVKHTKLEDVLQSNNFKEYWNVTKDQIDVCKDCEFRYICLDCRVFIKNKNDIHSQPAKCKYNPYIAKWEGEEDFLSVEEYKRKTN